MTTVSTKPQEKTYPRPAWLPADVHTEEELCPECFKVVGVQSRYRLVCMLGRSKGGLTVTELTNALTLKQPTVTHHLNVLKSVNAVSVTESGRERLYQLNRNAHCFLECQIPY